MSITSERLDYERKLSRKLARGPLYGNPWHPAWLSSGRSRKRTNDKYKNIDRATIRKSSYRQRSRAVTPAD
jgi:hypothetical protein